MSKLITRASSINRALDQIGDKWCLLILQEVFWGINTFSDMLEATGVSRGVLSDRLKWLQSVDCLRKDVETHGPRRPVYHLTRKSVDLYDNAMMAIAWERSYFRNPDLDAVRLVHRRCGKPFSPVMRCRACKGGLDGRKVEYRPGPGVTRDTREIKTRRRSSLSVDAVPSQRSVYRNLINLVGDRWTANVIALAFHGLLRFDAFHQELPVATNILSDRLKFLVEKGVFKTRLYRQRPPRQEYLLTDKGWDLFPWFLAQLQWGDRWCDPTGAGKPLRVIHMTCGKTLHGQVVCDQCAVPLKAHQVNFTID